MTLLSREEFSAQVFKRDKHTCIFCASPAVDAHHILDRKLWPDGGYYLSNGVSVCEKHHWDCEITAISVEAVRRFAKITEVLVPPDLDPRVSYDKWGNKITSYGIMAGPLARDTGCRKALVAGHKIGLLYD